MKIAVASMGNAVAGHFGHCENFNIFDAENGAIVKTESIPNPGHRPGFLPNFLGDMGVEVIIAGGMGGGGLQKPLQIAAAGEGGLRHDEGQVDPADRGDHRAADAR